VKEALRQSQQAMQMQPAPDRQAQAAGGLAADFAQQGLVPGDARLLGAQRMSVARQFGRMHGNRALQRACAQGGGGADGASCGMRGPVAQRSTTLLQRNREDEANGSATDGAPGAAAVLGLDLGTLAGVDRRAEPGPATLVRLLGVLRHPALQLIPGSVFPPVLTMLQTLVPVLEAAWRIYENPQPYLDRMRASVNGMLADASRRAEGSARAMSTPEQFACIWRHLEPKLQYMMANGWEVLQGMVGDLLWPWPGVASDFGAIWESLQSMWDHAWKLDFNRMADDGLGILRHLNAAAGRLYLWFLVGAVLTGAALGGAAGVLGGPGAPATVPAGMLAGAAAGLELAGSVGYGLLIATVAVEGLSVSQAMSNLTRDDRSEEEKECDCEVVASSGLTLAICGAMALLGAIAGRLAKALIQRVGQRVWRLPPGRGRGRVSSRQRRLREQQGERVPRNPRNRGDVAEARVTLAELTRSIFARRRITVTDVFTTADNMPGIDFTADSRVTLRSQATGQTLPDVNALDAALASGERIEIRVDGGRVFQVKSHGRISNLRSTLEAEIRRFGAFETGRFNRVHTAIVANPAERVFVAFLEEPLSAADLAALHATAANARVTFHPVSGGFPPGHPAVVPFEALPSVVGELAEGAARNAGGAEHAEDAGSALVTCPLGGNSTAGAP
jgi:hypothetical protein